MGGQTLRLGDRRGRGQTDIAGHQGPDKITAFVTDLGCLQISDRVQQAERLQDVVPADAADLDVIRLLGDVVVRSARNLRHVAIVAHMLQSVDSLQVDLSGGVSFSGRRRTPPGSPSRSDHELTPRTLKPLPIHGSLGPGHGWTVRVLLYPWGQAWPGRTSRPLRRRLRSRTGPVFPATFRHWKPIKIKLHGWQNRTGRWCRFRTRRIRTRRTQASDRGQIRCEAHCD